MLFPSQQVPSSQKYDTLAPRIITQFQTNEFVLEIEAFVDSTNHGIDILFSAIHVTHRQEAQTSAVVCVAVCPFNPEGVEPVQHVEFKNSRHLYVNKCLGLVFAEEPQWVACSNAESGDSVNIVRQIYNDSRWKHIKSLKGKHTVSCSYGLANAVAAFALSFHRSERKTLY